MSYLLVLYMTSQFNNVTSSFRVYVNLRQSDQLPTCENFMDFCQYLFKLLHYSHYIMDDPRILENKCYAMFCVLVNINIMLYTSHNWILKKRINNGYMRGHYLIRASVMSFLAHLST